MPPFHSVLLFQLKTKAEKKQQPCLLKQLDINTRCFIFKQALRPHTAEPTSRPSSTLTLGRMVQSLDAEDSWSGFKSWLYQLLAG